VGAEFASGRHRPGDFSITGWQPHQDTLFDVTTSHPSQTALLASSSHTTGFAAQSAIDRKNHAWAEHREGSREEFIPLAAKTW